MREGADMTTLDEIRARDLPKLLRDAERRVNNHVWPDRQENFGAGGATLSSPLVSIPANRDADVDLLLLDAADAIEIILAMLDALRAENEALRARVAELLGALKQYGQHLTGCTGLLYHGRHHPFGDCSCGFNSAAIVCGLRAALAATEKKP